MSISREEEKINVQRIVNQLWRPTDIDLPPFANDENTKLHGELHVITQQINTLVQELLQQEKYISSMEAHKGAVIKELQHAQERVDSKGKEVKAEEHLTNL